MPRRGLLLLFVLGGALRLWLLIACPGVHFDVVSFDLTGQSFLDHPLASYAVNVPGQPPRYPYPGALVPVLGALHAVSNALGFAFTHFLRVLPVTADLCCAALVCRDLDRRGADPRRQLAAAAAILLGPAFFLASAVHGQLDAAAWTFAFAALMTWDHEDRSDRRALAAGVLLAMGVAAKTPAGLVLFALLPTARRPREIAALIVPLAVIPALITLPLALHAREGLDPIVNYRGIPGFAGLATLVDPGLATFAFSGSTNGFSAAGLWVYGHAWLFAGVPVLILAAVLFRARARPAPAAVALVLAFLVLSPSVLSQYYLWPVPFLLVASRVRTAVVYQLVVLPVLLTTYLTGEAPALGGGTRYLSEAVARNVYVPVLGVVTLALAAGLVAAVRHALATGDAEAPGTTMLRELRVPDVDLRRLPAWPVVAVLVVLSVVVAIALDLQAAFDSEYHLLWARELLHGQLPSFDAYLTPTQHPLEVVAALPIVLVGFMPQQLLSALGLVCYGFVVWGVARLGAHVGGVVVGVTAAAVVTVIPPLFSLAALAYVDLAFVALMLWAVVFELEEHPGRRVPILIILAGLLRPEAWVFGGILWLYRSRGTALRERLRQAWFVPVAPVLWVLSDLAVTGDPAFSLSHTQENVTVGLRTTPISDIPHVTWQLLVDNLGAPVLLLGLAGAVVLLVMRPPGGFLLLAATVCGVLTFVATTANGLDPNARYVLFVSCLLCVSASYAAVGWAKWLPRAPRAWIALGILAALLTVAMGARDAYDDTRLRKADVADQLALREQLTSLVKAPAVRRTIECGGLTLPVHLFAPDVRWVLDLPASALTVRPGQTRRRATWIYVADRDFSDILTKELINVYDPSPPPAGYRPLLRSGRLAASGRCPGDPS